jgi:hypothetical protein
MRVGLTGAEFLCAWGGQTAMTKLTVATRNLANSDYLIGSILCLHDILIILRKKKSSYSCPKQNIKVFVSVRKVGSVQCPDGCINWIFVIT